VRIVLMVEGWTEKEKVLRDFLKRWLDPRLPQRVGLQAVRFGGNNKYLDDVAVKTQMYLEEDDVIAVFGLLDLYGLPPRITDNYPPNAELDEKIDHARRQITNLVTEPHRDRFRQHFAVHETEAWLLSDPKILPQDIRLPANYTEHPETIDFEESPAKRLDELWKRAYRGRGYKKVTQARNLFPRLDPDLVYEKCPNFKQMMDEMRDLALEKPRC
jgi:hypothetical protein